MSSQFSSLLASPSSPRAGSRHGNACCRVRSVIPPGNYVGDRHRQRLAKSIPFVPDFRLSASRPHLNKRKQTSAQFSCNCPPLAMSEPDAEPTLAAVEALSASLETIRGANSLSPLLSLLSPSSPPDVQTASAHALRRALPRLRRAASDEVGAWLEARQNEFARRLAECLVAGGDERVLVACAAVQSSAGWKALVRAVLVARMVAVLVEVVERYAELRIGALQVVIEGRGEEEEGGRRKKKRKRREDDAAYNDEVLKVLFACGRSDPVAASAKSGAEEEIPADVSKRLRRAFGDAWVFVLSDASLTQSQRASAVAALPKQVIPRMSNPLRLSDFLTATYDSGEPVVAVASLDALFLLISHHRLDYPDFYPKLYARLTPYALFAAPARNRFLALTAVFVTRGGYLPRTMVAAFVKRLMRRALVAPPAGAMWCMRLALDLLHKHPSVSFLVHKSVNLFEAAAPSAKEGASSSDEASDPFDDTASDPLISGADRSSLWELDVLRNHMSPAVSRLVDAFSKDVRKRAVAPPPGDLGDYASLTFADVFGAEFKRRAKTVPLAYCAPDDPSALEMENKLATALQW